METDLVCVEIEIKVGFSRKRSDKAQLRAALRNGEAYRAS